MLLNIYYNQLAIVHRPTLAWFPLPISETTTENRFRNLPTCILNCSWGLPKSVPKASWSRLGDKKSILDPFQDYLHMARILGALLDPLKIGFMSIFIKILGFVLECSNNSKHLKNKEHFWAPFRSPSGTAPKRFLMVFGPPRWRILASKI